MNGVPQGSVLGLMLLNILINDLDDEVNCILRKFTDDTILGAMLPSPEGHAAIQMGS